MDKILILGGAEVHCKLVEAAKNNGLFTVVVDYLEVDDSPAKQIADENYQINITDIDEIVNLCKKIGISAVLATHLDPCQIPYNNVCKKLKLPCLGSTLQFETFTNKKRFKELCQKYGVDVTEEYHDFEKSPIYPVFVKPVDSRGSRGQRKCLNQTELIEAVNIAKRESVTGEYIVERFYEGYAEIQATYYFVNGEGYLVRTADSYKGDEKKHLGNVITYGVSPSIYTDEYVKYINDKVINMLKSVGVKNGPVMIQGFYKEKEFYIFDQGFRFPGVDYERVYKKIYDIDLLDPLIKFSLSGEMPDIRLDNKSVYLKGKQFRTIFPLLREGTIRKIEGVDMVRNMENVQAFLQRKKIGEYISESNDINRRFAEIDIIADSNEEIQTIEKKIYENLSVKDQDNNELLIPLSYC